MDNTIFSCIIVDDDDFARETLEDILSTITSIKILKSLSESSMAIKYLATLKPDIAFLDINMPKKDGISVLNEINELELSTKVIFITAHNNYLLDALKKNAFDYLMKPIKTQDLEDVIERYSIIQAKKRSIPQTDDKQQIAIKQNNNKIVIKNAQQTLIFESKHIAYIKADGSYTTINLFNKKTYIISRNIGKVESLFPKEHFFKISRSIIVNTNYINRIDRLRKNIHLLYNDTNVVLKASKKLMYNLEKKVSTKH